MIFKNYFTALFILLLAINGYAQEESSSWGFEKKNFVGSQAFIVFTPFLKPSPEYFQLNFGHRFSIKDEISLEAITWTYQGPLGRPYGPNYEDAASNFPGDIKAIGGGIAYKRFIWKHAYVQLHATLFHQTYRDKNKKKIQSGMQLFNTLRVGYHFKIFKNKWYITPSIAFTSWPVNTNLPDSFQREEDKWSNYFLFEPGLQFGINF